jgi:hypothetical protein
MNNTLHAMRASLLDVANGRFTAPKPAIRANDGCVSI